MESYLRRCPSVLASVRSLTATHSMSACCSAAARNALRPMRPNPLIPTRTDMLDSSSLRRQRGGPGDRRWAVGPPGRSRLSAPYLRSARLRAAARDHLEAEAVRVAQV